jgi:excisionase family DNA binding protein
MSKTLAAAEVLTLEEAAAYLRLPVQGLRRMATRGSIPGRKVGKEWRFLRAALQDWLRGPDQRETILRQAGSWKDDPFLEEMLAHIYERRGRPMVEGKP